MSIGLKEHSMKLKENSLRFEDSDVAKYLWTIVAKNISKNYTIEHFDEK